MTTIAANRSEMASDSRISCENGEYLTCDDKIERVGDALVGCAGAVDDICRFMEWYRQRGERPTFGADAEFEAVEIDRDGIWFYDNASFRRRVRDKFMAVGSGSMAARAAMLCGKTPAEAVAVAIRCDKHSGGTVRRFLLREPG